MSFRISRQRVVVAAAGLALLLPAAALARATDQPELKRVGATSIVYRGPQIELALSYRYAASNPEGPWLLLDTQMTASRAPVEIKRSSIAVRTPSGRVVPLATQDEFASDYGTLAPLISQASVAREPMNYLLFNHYRRIEFFSQPAAQLVFPVEWLDNLHNSYGQLYFKIPGGITRGNYELLIDLSDGQVAVPFTI